MIGNSNEIPIRLNIHLDNEYKFQIDTKASITIKDLKNIILQKLGLYSVNYLIEYKERDYSKFESFTLKDVFMFIEKNAEYTINLKDIETYVKERQSQKVLITYEEGGEEFLVYNVRTMKLEKNIPEISSGIKFDKFPYNSRYCHIAKENKIVISGGIYNETGICSYDYDTNYLMDLPRMKRERQLHSMVSIGDNVFIIGGIASKSVDSFNLDFEDYQEYPDMNYDRKDPGVCIVNDCILYVFMGYSQSSGDIARNFERIDISAEPYSAYWELLPIQNPYDLKVFKTHQAIIQYESGFLFLGGFLNSTCDKNVHYFSMDDYSFRRSKFCLPTETAFGEKSMITFDNNDYYLFTYGTLKLIKYDSKKSSILELIL